jgi:SAM-dependent MidA family methyltransferase
VQLPDPSPEERAFAAEMRDWLARRIGDAGGLLSFDRYMDLVLYAPGRGYYVNGRRRFGRDGDFVTAPEVSPLFAQCLAEQVAECLERLGGGDVIEFGAGTGRMAADLLVELARLDRLPRRYAIVELSPDLRRAQAETLDQALAATVPGLRDRVVWLDRLPARPLDGVVVANELLDAMPVHRFRRHGGQWQELFVGIDDGGGPVDRWQVPHSPGLEGALGVIWPDPSAVAEGYQSEVNLRLPAWMDAVAGVLARGYLLLVDYGYTRREYYHPERTGGTLMCHYRHRAHADPYLLPGLQDVTANVDFTAVATAATAAGFALCGYTTQAHFLIACGLDGRLAGADGGDPGVQIERLQAVKRLTLPAEMGERFKVIGLARAAPAEMRGFALRDLRGRL